MKGPSVIRKVNIKPYSLWEVLPECIILTLRRSKGMGGLMENLNLPDDTGG